jgi:LacI family transcriptional regulator
MARMVDVAEKAGVSVKTVSRVLNNEPHVKDALRKRVQAAAAEVGYVPSTSARQLRGGRSYSVHMVSHSDRSSYVNAIQFGAVRACQARGYQLMISLFERMDEMDWSQLHARFARLMEVSKPDALLLVPPLSNNLRLAEVLSEFDVRVARVGPHDLPGSSLTVMIDEQAAARDLTRYLIDRGHTRIAFQRGKENQNATQERFRGYRDALDEAGIVFDPALVLPGNFEFSSGLTAGDDLLDRDDPPTAVFAANDDMAAGIVMAAHRRGVPVPERLSVVGFDDSEIADRTWPALTTVRQPLVEYGTMAVERLIDSLSATTDPEGAAVLLDYELIERDSVTTPATDPAKDL